MIQEHTPTAKELNVQIWKIYKQMHAQYESLQTELDDMFGSFNSRIVDLAERVMVLESHLEVGTAKTCEDVKKHKEHVIPKN